MRELQTLIEPLAEQLHRAVAIDDPALRLLAHTAHDEPVDEHRVHSIMTLRAGPDIAEYAFGLGIATSEAPVRIPRRADLKMLGRLCVPIRCQSLLLGYLWLIDDEESLSAAEIEASVRTAQAAGEVLFRNRLLDDLLRERERDLLLRLVGDDAAEAGPVPKADLDAVGLAGRLSCRVVVVEATHAEEEALEIEPRELPVESVLRRAARRVKQVRSLVATRPVGRGYLLVAFRSYEDPLEQLLTMAGAVHGEVAQVVPSDTDVRIGIGPLVPEVTGAALSFRRALDVVQVSRVVRQFAPVAAWDNLGVYRVLQQLPLETVADVAIPAGLRALIEAKNDQWLLDTLDTYLDAAGNVQESARRMQVHRATLYYRLSRIEELTGMSLSDGQDRLALHLGVKLARLTGAVGAAGTAAPGDAGQPITEAGAPAPTSRKRE